MQSKFAVFAAAAIAWMTAQAAAPALAQSQKPAPLVLSTASTGGAFHQGGVSLSALVKIKLLPTKQIDLATSNSTGSLENMARLNDRTSDFAIVQSLLGHYARSGTGVASVLGPQRDLRAVMMLWPNVEHFIIRKSLVTSGTIEDFAALKGKRVSLGRERSAIESNRVLLSNLGLDIDRDIDQALLPFRPSVAAFQRGEIDGLSLPASTPVPAFTDLMSQLGPDAVLLRWTEDQLRRADAGLGIWSLLTLPADTYEGQDGPFKTIAQPNFLAVHADVDEDVVYAITKTIFENLPFLSRLHAPFSFLTPERAVTGLPVPLHPGAMRYYEEMNVAPKTTAVAKSGYRLFGDDTGSQSSVRRQVGQGLIRLITTEDKTSNSMVDDLLDVMDADPDVRVLPIRGKGAAHNLADLLYLDGIDIAVLQADALERDRSRSTYPDLVNNIRHIAKWTDAEVHLLVRGDILDVKDLRDQPVNFGPVGSGSEVTASLLFDHLELQVKQQSDGHGQALKKLKDGKIAGMLYIAPKPASLFRDIEVRDGLRFLSIPLIEKPGVYRAAGLNADDYPSLIFGKQSVKTMAVPLVLATYNWPSNNVRYRSIANFVESFLKKFGDLQDDRRHAKWKEADPAFDLKGWQRHPVAANYIGRLQTAAGSESGRGGPFTRAVSTGKIPAPQEKANGQTRPNNPIVPAKGAARRPVF